jgi:hypothetical protein
MNELMWFSTLEKGEMATTVVIHKKKPTTTQASLSLDIHMLSCTGSHMRHLLIHGTPLLFLSPPPAALRKQTDALNGDVQQKVTSQG